MLGQCTALEDKLADKMGPLTTPTKRRDVRSVDPWTPTSNLKMLISAASPDIRNREKELYLDHQGEAPDIRNQEKEPCLDHQGEAPDTTPVQRRTTRAHVDTSIMNGV